MRSVLLVDDDPAVLGFVESVLRRSGYAVTTAATGAQALDSYTRDSTDLVVLDLNLPDLSGQEVLERLRGGDPDATVIMLTAQADLQTAVEAMRAGAENFLPKPIEPGHLRVAVERAFEKLDLRRRARYLEERVQQAAPEGALGKTGAMREVAEKVTLVAPMSTTVLLLGETGTGKSWVARRIHDISDRHAKPFVEVNCAGLTATFLDSELFGHEKGAFTDAKTLKRGLLEVADGGTLFLDEIGDLAPDLQPKLLTFLETRRFRRLGGTRDLEIDVRLIAATNVDLQRAVAEGRFREDLYYRIAVMPIVLPPLREREPDELRELAYDLLLGLSRGMTGPERRFSPEAMRRIVEYDWPGNIREMRNVIERALILSGGAVDITEGHLPAEVRAGTTAPARRTGDDVHLTLEEVQRRHIRRVLEHCGGNRSRAAELLGVSRAGLYKMLRRLDGDTRTG